MSNSLSGDILLRLAALLAALAAITAEDIAALQQAEALGPDEATNITNLQAMTAGLDADTIKALNDARLAAGLPAV